MSNTKENLLKEQEQRERTFNGLTAKEWAARSRSVWNDVSSVRRSKHKINHGATYPEDLCNRVIEMYSKAGDTILDPFLGTGTTLVSAIALNRHGIGIEITDEYFKASQQRIAEANNLFNTSKIELLKGDCLTKLSKVKDNFVQLTLTSPPYADLIHKTVEDRTKRHKHSIFNTSNKVLPKVYSNNEEDLGNMSFEEYVIAVEKVMQELYKKTKQGGYNVWVVKDYRDTKNNIPYIDLHSAVANAGVKAGFKYHDLIIWDQSEQRKLVVLGYPSVFYVNQNHSYLVILRKM